MKSGLDDAQGLLIKAEHDIRACEIGLEHDAPRDTICFHIEQAAEKLLKALLSRRGVVYPFTHDLQELLEAACTIAPSLSEFSYSLAAMTPYAVRIRYDQTIYPAEEEAREALEVVLRLRSIIHGLLPPGILPGTEQR
jgi:HEPN domain-containing protein